MGPFVLAWMLGIGTEAYWSVTKDKLPPSPGRLLVGSGFFAVLAVLAKTGPGPQRAATLLAFGIDIAAWLQGYQGKPNTVPFPAAGSAGSAQIIPDGGPGGAFDCDSSGSGGTGNTTDYASSTGGATGGNATANQRAAQTVISSNTQFQGWDSGSQWLDLIKLWNQESGWNSKAQNSSSGALGIAQALGHGNGTATAGTLGNEYGGFGLTDKQAQAANSGDAAAQILWGLNYILSTYGSPTAAWNHEIDKKWY